MTKLKHSRARKASTYRGARRMEAKRQKWLWRMLPRERLATGQIVVVL